jgi:hypothetical protein
MSRHRLGCATRLTAAGVASLVLLLPAAAARAGEVVSTTCMHGYGTAHTYQYGNTYADQYGSGYGDNYGRSSSYTVPQGFGFRRGLADGRRGDLRGRLVTGSRDANGGGSVSGSEGGASNGSGGGSGSGYGGGTSADYGSDGCIEIRHELVNPNVIPVPQPQSDVEFRAAAEHDKLWTARCKPVVRQDRHGVDRYVYAAPGCDYGRYE